MIPVIYFLGVMAGFILIGVTDWFGLKDRTFDPLRDDEFSIRRRNRENEETACFISAGVLFWPMAVPLVAICWAGYQIASGAIHLGELLRRKISSRSEDYDA